jgi:hypothetical protein
MDLIIAFCSWIISVSSIKYISKFFFFRRKNLTHTHTHKKDAAKKVLYSIQYILQNPSKMARRFSNEVRSFKKALSKAINDRSEDMVADLLTAIYTFILSESPICLKMVMVKTKLQGEVQESQRAFAGNQQINDNAKKLLDALSNTTETTFSQQAIPPQDACRSFRISFDNTSDYVAFNSKSKDPLVRQLSNFHAGDAIVITFSDGLSRTYSTGEHAFQAAKFIIAGLAPSCSTPRRDELMTYATMFECGDLLKYKSPSEAKRAGKKLRLDGCEMSIWHNETRGIQRAICHEKLKSESGRPLRDWLVGDDNRGKYLVHHEPLGR